MATMRVAQVSRPGGPLELVERPIPEPGQESVRVKVQACGICHSDVMTKEGLWPGITYPRVPGHEVIGVIDAVGEDVPRVAGGPTSRRRLARLALPLMRQLPPRRLLRLPDRRKVTGISFDGGYADYMIAPATALALVPAELPASDTAPLMCAGLTTFTALRNSGARAGRPRRGAWHRRTRSSRRSVRGQDGVPHGCHRPREGQRGARPTTRRITLHRQPIRRPGC